jgi:purine-binding chemotaxis protein CheW
MEPPAPGATAAEARPPAEALPSPTPAPRRDVAATPPARRAATPAPAPRAAVKEHEPQLVIFVLASEHYGVGISAVDSIIKLQPITFVPHAPAFVEGVTNLRGKVLPVVDLRKRFGLPIGEATKETRIVVTQVGGLGVGMMVDRVSEVLRVPAEAIEPPSPLVTTVDSAFITGIAKVDDRLVILLDLEQVLSPGEKTDLQAVPAWPGEAEA